MIDQQNFDTSSRESASEIVTIAPKASKVRVTSVESLAEDLGLTLGDQENLTITRKKRGKTYNFLRATARSSNTAARSSG